jgi:hypothetical protein
VFVGRSNNTRGRTVLAQAVAGILVTTVVDNPDREPRIVRPQDRLRALESVGQVVPVEDHDDHECAVRWSGLRKVRGPTRVIERGVRDILGRKTSRNSTPSRL